MNDSRAASANCAACGSEVHPWAASCVVCGAARTPSPVELPAGWDLAGEPSRRAIAALVLSILGLALFLPLLSIPGGVLGYLELSAIRTRRAPAGGESLARGAVLLAALAVAATILAAGLVMRWGMP